jgi:hypothetical protein
MSLSKQEEIFLEELDWEINWEILDKFDFTTELSEEIKEKDRLFQEEWENILQDFNFEEEEEVQQTIFTIDESSTSSTSECSNEIQKEKKRKRGKYKCYTMKQPRQKGVWKRGPYRKTRKLLETVL